MIGMELRHGSAVTGVRKVDEWKVVVCGLESRVSISKSREFLSATFSWPRSLTARLRMAPH